MKNGKKTLFLGIIIGVVISYFFFNYFAPRYEIKKTAALTMKVDKWTGDAWRLVDNNWKKMSDMDENWELVDKTLGEAINMKLPIPKVDSNLGLKKLKDRYPALKDIPDDDLLERIKLVYSKQVMVNMYLGDFMKAGEETQESQNP
ncbi:MAG: hypothetical protein GX654_11285 [Desulfatiglans sp.]|jgi:hypothetical protein|nr:hypothetical protein [Desulfatiglans sp.]